jgi:hypothetical protein
MSIVNEPTIQSEPRHKMKAFADGIKLAKLSQVGSKVKNDWVFIEE